MTNADAAALEMLWEGHDPGTVLTDRFGFRDAAAAARWVTSTVRSHWEIEIQSCERIVMSFTNALAWVRTPEGRMIAKWSIATPGFARLAALADVIAWLDRCGLPVSALVPTTEGRHQVEVDGVSVGLQRQIDGELLDVTAPDQVRAAGSVLARLHEVLSSYPDAAGSPWLAREWPQPLAAQISIWLEDDHPTAPTAALDLLRQRLATAPADPLPQQLVHGDFRAANVLISGGIVTAVLDFEEARLDHRVVELARSAVLLGTKFHDWGPITAGQRTAFLDGYQSVCRLTSVEAAWWDTLVLWFSLAMIPDGDDPTGWAAAAAQWQLQSVNVRP